MPQIGLPEIVDTPADGENTKGISSNWAFDENATLRALIETSLPWTIFIDVFMTPKSNINWDTLIINSLWVHCGTKQSSTAQNDEITWDIVLGAGTWSIELMFVKLNSGGIFSVQFDSVEVGTIDSYLSSTVHNSRSSLIGIVIPKTKKIELKLKMATKNTNSSSYYGVINGIKLIRTA